MSEGKVTGLKSGDDKDSGVARTEWTEGIGGEGTRVVSNGQNMYGLAALIRTLILLSKLGRQGFKCKGVMISLMFEKQVSFTYKSRIETFWSMHRLEAQRMIS